MTALMGLLKEYLLKEREEMLKNNIRLSAIGKLEDLPAEVFATLKDAIKKTEHCDGMILNLALSYGGRSEYSPCGSGNHLDLKKGRIKEEEIDLSSFPQYLWTRELPDPDLLIRTSGESRISNFLLYQIAYTELYLTETLWPDFNREELLKAIADYQLRERRFGLTSEQINGL